MLRSRKHAGAVLLAALGAMGCANEAAYDTRADELQRARYYAALRDQENVALAWRQQALVNELQVRQAELQQATTAQQYVRKLEELMALEADMSKRLSSAEHALEELAQTPSPSIAPRAKAELA